MRRVALILLSFFLFFILGVKSVNAACSAPALCDAVGPGECSSTCNGGEDCYIQDRYSDYVCSTSCSCIINGSAVPIYACSSEGAPCGPGDPYNGNCDCTETCDTVSICNDRYWASCCNTGTKNLCGNGVVNAGETCSTCPADAGACPPACGDGACNGTETCSSCSSDCGACSGGGSPPANYCGNGNCAGSENCSNCAADCGSCTTVPACGNGVCSNGETCSTCSADCGICSNPCGNGICSGTETCSSCPGDCGSCVTNFCGDNACNGFETCGTCSDDCGVCPTDVAWWQASNAHGYAGATTGPGIVSAVPSSCTEPNCTPAIFTADSAGTADTDGFALTGGGAVVASGFVTERQPNIQVIGTNLGKFTENYDYFYREFSLGSSPTDDFAANGGNATKPVTPPANGRAYYHNSGTAGTYTIQERWNVTSGDEIVIFIEGDMVITNPSGFDDLITVEPGGFVSFIVSGNLTIDETVGNSSVSNTAANIEGVYIVDGNITIESTNDTATEKRFVGEGSFVGWQGIVLDRDLGTATNVTTPAETFRFRPDMVESVPERMARPRYVWQETN